MLAAKLCIDQPQAFQKTNTAVVDNSQAVVSVGEKTTCFIRPSLDKPVVGTYCIRLSLDEPVPGQVLLFCTSAMYMNLFLYYFLFHIIHLSVFLPVLLEGTNSCLLGGGRDCFVYFWIPLRFISGDGARLGHV